MRINIFFFAALLLVSCVNQVRFEEPQPAGKANEKRIPNKLLGQYMSLDDSATLIISHDLVVKYSVSDFFGTADSISTNGNTVHTTYTDRTSGLNVEVSVKGDSTFQRWGYYDTLFDATKGDILRKYKGHYFLNKKMSPTSWQVTTLTKIRNGVTHGKISMENDIDNLRAVTDTQADTISDFRPTKQQMKKFLQAHGFSNRDTFIKVK